MSGVSYPQITARISGNTAGATANISTGTVVLAGGNNITLSQNANSVTISGPTQTTQPGIQSVSAGTTRVTTGEVVLSNSNGISFGANGNTITASYTVPSVTNSSWTVSDAATSMSIARLALTNSNGLTLSLSTTTGGSATIVGSYTVPTVTNSSMTVSDSGTSGTLARLAFTNLNGVTLSLSTGAGGSHTIVGSHNALTSQSSQAFSAQGGSSTFQTLSFGNSNGLSFSNSNGSVVASYTVPTQTAQTLGLYASSNTTGQSSSTTVDARTLSVRGAGIVSVGYSGGELIVSASAAGAADGFNILAAGTQTAATNTSVKFADSNGISFGMSNSSQITASYTVPTVTNSSMTVSDSGTSGTLARLAFTNLNGVTLSLSTGAGGSHTIVGSHNALTSQSNQAFSAAGGSSAFQTLSFSNANGATFSNNAGQVQLSYTVPTQTNQSGGIYAVGNTTGQSSSSTYDARTLSVDGAGMVSVGWSNSTLRISATQSNQTVGIYGSSQTTGQSSSSTFDARSLTFRGAGIVSVGNSGGEVIISAVAAGAGDGVNILAAGTQTAGTNTSVKFADSNGISFGMSASSQITASYTVPTVTNSSWTASDAATSLTIGQLAFSQSNGLTLSLSTTTGGKATVVGSYTVPSTAGLLSNVNLSAGTTSNNLSAFVLSNSNGVSFGLNGSTVTASYTVPTVTNSSMTVSDNGTSGTLARLAFTNLNGVTLSLSTGAGGSHTIVGSHNALTSQSNQAFSAAGGSSAFQTLSFSNANGATFSNNAGQVQLSYTVPSTAGLLSAVNLSAGTTSNNLSAFVASNSNNVSFGLNGSTLTASASFAAQTNQTLGLYASSNTTGQSSSTTIDARSFSVRGAGNASVGYSGGELIISVTGGGGADGVNILAAGTQTANTTGTVMFSNSNGVTFGMQNSSIITASYTVPTVTNSSWTVSDSVTSMTIGQLAFTGSNGLTLTLSTTTGGKATVIGSYTVPTQTNQTLGGYAVGNTTGQSSSSTFDARTLSFNGAGNVSVGYSAGSVVISGGTAAASPVNFSAGTTSNNLGTVVFSNSNGVSFGLNGSTITASAAGGGGIQAGVSTDGQTYGATGMISAGNLVFVGGNGIWLSQTTGAAGNSATITFIGQGLSYCVSQFPKQAVPLATSSAYSGSTTTTAGGSQTTFSYYLSPFVVDEYVTFNQVFANVSIATVAGTYSQTYAHMFALYSKVGETLSTHMTFGAGMVWSQNSVTAVTGNWWWGSNSTSNSSQTSGNVSASFGNRLNNVLLYTGNSSLTPGQYWLAYAYSGLSTQSSNGQSVMFVSQSQTTMGSMLGTNVSADVFPNHGIVSTTYSTDSAQRYYFPPTISTSAITGTGGSSQNRSNVIFFVSN